MALSGGYEVVPENRIDPVNDIPKFQGHPAGGPVYSDTKPTPWIEPSRGGVASDARYGTGGEDTMSMNERDWLEALEVAYKDYDKVPNTTRSERYEAAMGALAKKYPDDVLKSSRQVS
jgi:hypothetical protein